MKTRYVMAQVVILTHWVIDWAIFGTSPHAAELPAEGVVEALLVLLVGWLIPLYPPLTLTLAVIVGIFDGIGGRGDKAVQTALVVGFAALVSFLGLGLPELLGGGYALPVLARVYLLIAMEELLLLEWGIAALVRLGRRRRGANAS